MSARPLAAPVLLAAGLAACGPAEPGPLPRIAGATPSGEGLPTTVAPEVRFTAPVDAAALEGGGRIVLVEAPDLARALGVIESEEGAAGAGLLVRAVATDGGHAVALRPLAPLRAWLGHAVVVSSRLRAADGRTFLDPAGRRRTFVATFATGAAEGPPPLPALTEVRADAETPEAGGEYVEVVNLGEGLLDLRGWRLGKVIASGLSWCAIAGAADAIGQGGVALLAGGAWDGRYAVPAGVPVLGCGATALAGGLANDRAPGLVLADPVGQVRATLGAAGAPRCPVALEKVDPRGPDAPANLACTAGSPGRY